MFAVLFFVFMTAGMSAGRTGQTSEPAKMASAGWQAFQAGHAITAKDYFAEAVHLSPAQPQYRVALAEIEWSLGERRLAISQLEIALKLDPSDIAIRSRLAKMYELQNEDLQVIRVLSAPDPPEPTRAIWRFSRGYSLFRLGRLAAARREFLPIATYPNFEAPVNFFLGRIAYMQNRFEEALPYFARALQIGDPSSNRKLSSYAYNYGLSLFKLGRYAEANSEFALSTEQYALEPLAWMMRARCDEQLSNYQAAIDEYEKSININPNFELSYYHLARLHQRYGDPHRANELFSRLAELRRNDLKEAQSRALQQAIVSTRMKTHTGQSSKLATR